jgi:hypothetical protein
VVLAYGDLLSVFAALLEAVAAALGLAAISQVFSR